MDNLKARGDQKFPDYQVVVIGAGPGGIAAGVALKKAGIGQFIILERAESVGGSWRDNNYPGIGVDVPCFSYEYSFARNADWSRLFPKGEEVRAYHEEVSERFGLDKHLKFASEVVQEIWDDQNHIWKLYLKDGQVLTTRYLINAIGAFINPKKNIGIPGLDEYQGKIQSPTDWDHDFVLKGKRVAVIGTGASSVQISPAIAPEVERLSVFQRTPVYCFRKPDMVFKKWHHIVLRIPGVSALLGFFILIALDMSLRAMLQLPNQFVEKQMTNIDRRVRKNYRAYVHRVVKDEKTASALSPDFGFAAKRPTISNKFLKTFNRNNTELITTPIVRFTNKGILTEDGREHEFDMIVLATGYELFSDPESYRQGVVVGRNGFDLGNFYNKKGLQAYESVSVPGLPNRWTLVGPYSWTGTGWHFMVESSARHAVRVIKEANKRHATRVEVKRDAHDAYHNKILKRSKPVRYYYTKLNKGVRTYYVNSQGDNTYIRPSSVFETLWKSYRFPIDDYKFV